MKKEATVNQNKIEREDMTLLRTPGYVYNLLFVFAAYFNEENLSNTLNERKKEKFLEFLKNGIRPYFGEISDDLYVFFHALEHGRCFVTAKYFKTENLKNMSFEGFIEMLSDKEKLICNLINFYFHDVDAEALAPSKDKIFPVIKSSAYSAEEKAKLYEFFLEPDYYIDLLQKQLNEKEKLLAKYYADNYGIALELFNNTTLVALAEQMQELECGDIYKSKTDSFYMSVCLLNKDIILHFGKDDEVFAVLGCEYKETLESIRLEKKPDLKGLGCVIAEESRVKILAFLLKNGEAACKDLEKNFTFSGSTAYHHLTMMCRVGIVKYRVVKKTVLYSINRQYVDRILGVLLDYSSYKDVSEIK